MRKTDKKIDNKVRCVLTEVCEIALKDIDGFVWLTHLVSYSNFPSSLKVVCVFDTNDSLSVFMSQKMHITLNALIGSKLKEADVEVKNIMDHVFYDTQQNCEKEHNGQWAKRLEYSS
jgi:hypothetical protein